VRTATDLTFIDWDGAGPGSRLWDLAYAAHGFVPLSDDASSVTRVLPRGSPLWLTAMGLAKRIVPISLTC
jgi:hypothetical protein